MPPPAAFTSLADLLRYRAQITPDRLAYRFLKDGADDNLEISYHSLYEQAQSIADKLHHLGVAGERALLMYPPGLDFIAALFGCFYSNTIAVPIPAFHPAWIKRKQESLRHVMYDATPSLIMTTQNMGRSVRQAFRQNKAIPRTRWLFTDTVSPSPSTNTPSLPTRPIALLQYTSGSTRKPRGVKVSHLNLMHNNERIRRGFGHSETSHAVLWLPHHHDMGLVGILQGIYTGFPQTLMSPLTFLQHPFRWLRAISIYRGTTSGGPNFAFERCLQTVSPTQRDTLDLSTWDLAFIGAEPVRSRTLKRFASYFSSCGFKETAWFPSYGLAESTVMVTGTPKGSRPTIRMLDAKALQHGHVVNTPSSSTQTLSIVSCGTSYDGQVHIVDPHTCQRCTSDQIGEIWISSNSVSEGYWQNQELTDQAFRGFITPSGEGPFLRTGDLGFIQEGELFITGRLKELIVINGRNHYPYDIEATVSACHPAIQSDACAAFSVLLEDQETLVLALELKRSSSKAHSILESRILGAQESVFEKEILIKIRSAVSTVHDLHVHDVLLIPFGHLPKTSSGKTKRLLCRDRYLAHSKPS